MTCVLDACTQGREACPDPAVCCGRTRRQQEADLRWQCRDQMDARQFAAHTAAGDFLPLGDHHAGIVGYAPAELDAIGVEAADAARVTGAVPIVTYDIKPAREPWWRLPALGARKPIAVDWQGVVVYGSAVACLFIVGWLSTADPRDLSSFWPRVLALLSF